MMFPGASRASNAGTAYSAYIHQAMWTTAGVSTTNSLLMTENDGVLLQKLPPAGGIHTAPINCVS
jgi:hypothetical protein